MANRFLTLDEIVSEAMGVIPGATTEDALWAKTWAYIALREIGPTRDNVGVCTLYPEDFVLVKPDDFHSAIDIALFDSGNNELRSKYRSGNKRIHQSLNYIEQVDLYDTTLGNSIEVSEDAHFFHLSSNSTDVSYAKLRYFRLPVDDEGNPMFPEYTRLAVTLFIRYMWALRTEHSSAGEMGVSWKIARAEARGKNRLSGLLYKQIAKEWPSMIPNNKFDRF